MKWSLPAIVIALAIACGPAPASTPSGPAAVSEQPRSGGTLKVIHREDPPSLSILEEATNSTQFPIMHSYNNLVQFDPKKAPETLETIVPDLAHRWAVSQDGKSITFELNQGVKWHDGTPFTSKDIKYSFDTAKTGTDSIRSDLKMRGSPRASWWGNIESIETPNELTAVFKLNRPQPSLLGMFAASYTPVYPSHVPITEMRTKIMGTGPFKLDEWRKGETLIFKKNAEYWRQGKPYLDGVQFVIIPQVATQVAAMKTHQVQVSYPAEFNKDHVDDLKQAVPGLVVDEQVSTGRDNVPMNTKKAPWNDIRVRMAVAEAMDKDAYVVARSGGATPGTNLTPGGPYALTKEEMAKLPGYGSNIEERRAKARRLLAEAGYPNGFDTELITRSITVFTSLAPYTIGQLEKIGIRATLKVMEQPVYVDAIYKANFEIASNSNSTGFDDPDVYWYENFKCGELRNYAHWCDQEIQAMTEEQSSSLDAGKRKQILQQMDRKIIEQAAWPTLGWRLHWEVWWPEVKGYRAMSSVQNAPRLDHVWIAQ